jgi:hypothetical protein
VHEFQAKLLKEGRTKSFSWNRTIESILQITPLCRLMTSVHEFLRSVSCDFTIFRSAAQKII